MTGMRREMKLISTAGIEMKLRCEHRSYNRNLRLQFYFSLGQARVDAHWQCKE